jgi:hypothetical protein
MIPITGIKRDLLFLGLLVVMIKIALSRTQPEAIHPILYAPAEHARVGADQYHPAKPTISEATTFSETVTSSSSQPAPEQQQLLHAIETAHGHITHLLTRVKSTTKKAAQLQSMQQRLVHLKQEYKQTKPAFVLLGALGTASIKVKENELEKNLLRTINMTRAILQTFCNDGTSACQPYTSISQGLEHNTQLIASLGNA